MAESKELRLRKMLMKGEKPFYVGHVHPSAYFASVMAILFGGVLSFAPELFDPFLKGDVGKVIKEGMGGAGEILFGIVIMLMGMVLGYQIHRQRVYTIDAVTNLRVLHVAGASDKKRMSIFLHRIERVRVKRSMFERLMFRGRVFVDGKTKEEHIELPMVAEPKEMVRAIHYAKERFQERTKIMHKDLKKREKKGLK